MQFTRRLFSYRQASEAASKWFDTKWGFRFRFGLLTSTVVVPPIWTLLFNGPFVDKAFSWKYKFTYDLPEHLREIIKSQYEVFLHEEGRKPEDAVVTFACSTSHDRFESVAKGSMGVRSGARIALPFYARFRTMEEVMEYCKEKLQPLNFFGEPACVLWDSDVGHEIAETFLLSEKELKFLILRDLYAHDGYSSFANRAGSWATYTTFSGMFGYWLHKRPRFQGSALAFAVIYTVCTACAYYSATEWYRLSRYCRDIHADATSSHTSFDHGEGGKEYYWKMLKRNRLLKDMIPNGSSHVTMAGDVRGITTMIMTRYDLLKDVNAEDDELKEVVEHDD